MFVVPFAAEPVGLGMPSFVFVASLTMLFISRSNDDDPPTASGSRQGT